MLDLRNSCMVLLGTNIVHNFGISKIFNKKYDFIVIPAI